MLGFTWSTMQVVLLSFGVGRLISLQTCANDCEGVLSNTPCKIATLLNSIVQKIQYTDNEK